MKDFYILLGAKAFELYHQALKDIVKEDMIKTYTKLDKESTERYFKEVKVLKETFKNNIAFKCLNQSK